MNSETIGGIDMQRNNKSSEQKSIHSTTSYVNCPLWWSSTGPHIPQSYPENFFMTMDPVRQDGKQLKRLGPQMPDQGSSSTQSTDQSNQELSGSSESNLQEQGVSTQSGNDSTYENPVQGHMSAVSLGIPEAVVQPPKFDYNTAVACVPYAYADPCYGGVLAPYGSHPIIHPYMVGMGTPASSRVPLPPDPAEAPMYVNAKQYHAIIRRREARAKQQAQLKPSKGRLPYLHESRHAHATNRPRGPGGRFLNKKELEEHAQLLGNGGTAGSPAVPTRSDVSNGNGGSLHKPDHLGFLSDAG